MERPIEPPPGAARLAFFTPVREYPPLSDRKASVLLAADGLMVTALVTFSGSIEKILTGSDRWASVPLLTVLIALAALILLGAWYAFLSLTRPIPPMPDSMAFYPHIAAMTLEGYRSSVLDLDHPRAVRAMLDYNYSLATLSVEKFRLVDRSLALVRSTFALWTFLLLLIIFSR
jgi:Family of unknown function (DUF5706)